MEFLQPVFLCDVTPGLIRDRVTIKVNCISPKEFIHLYGPHGRPIKEMVSIYFVLYNGKATRMLGRLKTEEAIEHFEWRLCHRVYYNITSMLVKPDGEGVHDKYHLEFLPTSPIHESSKHLPKYCFNLKPVDFISWNLMDKDGLIGKQMTFCIFVTLIATLLLFGSTLSLFTVLEPTTNVCGFLGHVSEVHMAKFRGYYEKEMVMMLETRRKTTIW